jgi:pyrimidine operon attenuation protein/uracil phosphoribosyltransferase
MKVRRILDHDHFSLTLKRLCFQLIENHDDFTDCVLIGLQPRGVFLSRRIRDELQTLTGISLQYGELDSTFFRDDFRLKPLVPNPTNMDFIVDDKKVVLVDDVLFTGRSIRASLDALQHYGRPSKIELLVLVDRRLSRHVPVRPDYVGITVDVLMNEKVIVNWQHENDAEIMLEQFD